MSTIGLPFYTSKPEPVYRFVWNAKKGPVVRHFASPHLFDAYIREVKSLAPEVCLTWVTPLVAIGCLP